MCRWMGLHFHNWTDYNFSRVTRMGSHISRFLGQENFGKQGFKNGKIRG